MNLTRLVRSLDETGKEVRLSRPSECLDECADVLASGDPVASGASCPTELRRSRLHKLPVAVFRVCRMASVSVTSGIAGC